jgi:hypothetical protein
MNKYVDGCDYCESMKLEDTLKAEEAARRAYHDSHWVDKE